MHACKHTYTHTYRHTYIQRTKRHPDIMLYNAMLFASAPFCLTGNGWFVLIFGNLPKPWYWHAEAKSSSKIKRRFIGDLFWPWKFVALPLRLAHLFFVCCKNRDPATYIDIFQSRYLTRVRLLKHGWQTDGEQKGSRSRVQSKRSITLIDIH